MSPSKPVPNWKYVKACAETGGIAISDGVHEQLIGKLPDSVLMSLTDRKDLGIHTEMFSDGVLALERRGVLDPGWPLVASFLFGSPELYEWVDHNPRVRMLRTERTNDPGAIARNPQVVSVNTAMQVDLFAQANASRINGLIYSGFGGQLDFVRAEEESRQRLLRFLTREPTTTF